MKVFTKLASAAALCALLGSAQAAICTATSIYTNPDATVTNATSCGVGIVNDINDDAVDLNSLMVGGLTTWASIAKVNAPFSLNNGLMTTGTSPAGSSGSWAFDDLPAYDTYTLVIKDGGSPGGGAPSIFWAWFVVDTAAGCDITSAISGKDYCGLWSMYGDDGKLKNISHISLYGANRGGGGGTGANGNGVPEPATLALVGLGLLGAAAARRRRV